MKIWNFIIEPLEERYSIQWRRWFDRYFCENAIEAVYVEGKTSKKEIVDGSFLDVVGTNEYKCSQMAVMANRMSEVEDGDVFFFHDLWNPCVMNLKYMLDGLGLKRCKIYGCLHAGSYDENDFLSKSGMEPWASDLETSLVHLCEKIFFATDFSRRLYCKTSPIGAMERVVHHKLGRLVVTGFPIYKESSPDTKGIKKGNICVFPHRLDPEKNPQEFNVGLLRKVFPLWNFVYSKEEAKSKNEYYRLLDCSDIAVSFADQETWGIAMQEAVMRGCVPLVPDRLSYCEMYPREFRYKSMGEFYEKLLSFIASRKETSDLLLDLRESLKKKGAEAIPNMAKEMGLKGGENV